MMLHEAGVVISEPRRNMHLPNSLNISLLTRSNSKSYSAMQDDDVSAISVEMDYAVTRGRYNENNDNNRKCKSRRRTIFEEQEEVWTDVCGWNCVKLKHCRLVSWLFQVILTVITIVGSLAASLSIGWTSRVFESEGGCLLYSKLLLDSFLITSRSVNTSIQGETKNVVSLDTELSIWGANSVCSYTTYTYATAAICRGIWLWMYIMLHKWFMKSNLNPNRRLLPCALMLNIALWLFTTIALGFVNQGIKEWCRNIELHEKNACHFLSNIPWYTKDVRKTFNYTQILLASSWVVFIGMSLNIITDVLTILADTSPPIANKDIHLNGLNTFQHRPMLGSPNTRKLTFELDI